MMRRLLAALLMLAIPTSPAAPASAFGFGEAEQKYSVTGMVLKVDRARLTFMASIQEIPGFMAAMAMPLRFANGKTSTAWCRAPPSRSYLWSMGTRHTPRASASCATKAPSRIRWPPVG